MINILVDNVEQLSDRDKNFHIVFVVSMAMTLQLMVFTVQRTYVNKL